ncbi:MAG: 2-glucan synthetase [Candidatus Tokpelaia sp. JSC188]|nr:MAG: 2-glucan synthetase [Candidatus Tokpelaia sp. JSC188]
MANFALFARRLFFHWEKIYCLRQPILLPPIRAPYKTEKALHNLAKGMVSDKTPELPAYVPLFFEKRLLQNAKITLNAFRKTDAFARDNDTISPAAHWLIDNYHIIDNSLQQTRRCFPKKFLRQLPVYSTLPNLPKIFVLAWFYVAHTDSNFSLKTLTAMIEGYQKIIPLQIGELWAISSAIRFVLIENARRLSVIIVHSHRMRQAANQMADKVVLTRDEKALDNLFSFYKELVADKTFSSHLLQRLRNSSISATIPLTWLEQHLAKFGTSIEEIMAQEHNYQTASCVTMGNIIKSLKAIDDVNWTTWFESVSYVDFLLKDNTDFNKIDFHSRNAYRIIIEKIARRSPLSESEVTQKAIMLAAKSGKGKNPTHSIGWYLIDKDRSQLEKACSYRPSLIEIFMHCYRNTEIWGIIVPVSLLAITIIASVYSLLVYSSTPEKLVLLFTSLAFFPAMDMAFSLFNTLFSWFIKPRRLIGYEYKNGIPENARTLVVVPTFITSHDSINEHIRNLEVHYLSNPRGAISFALITDWVDAQTAETSNDLALLNQAKEEIAKLNKHYCGNSQPVFFLLHRRRLFNKREGCWMGWERKRGKLHELNKLLRRGGKTSFLPHDPRLPSNIRFVMTLDSDTRLTPNAVTRMVGKLNHSLNQPRFKIGSQRVIKGYSILQPRVTPSLNASDESSFLQRVFSVDRGIDPYVFAISDTYQDLLGEGTFTGKGLYEIDAFETALKGQIDENTVLSHDLLEGGYARTAFISDVEIIEDYPTTYHVDAARHHRWVRGDWQLLPYLFKRRQINLITRWKLQDNLRRSLTPFAWIIASITSWCLMPFEIAIFWQLFLVASMHISSILGIVRNIVSINHNCLIRAHCQSILIDIATVATNILLKTTFLAHTAYYMMDAIIRSLYRMGISHRHLLEWRTSAATRSTPNTLIHYIVIMWPASVIGIFSFALPAFQNNTSIPIAIPFTFLWLFSPFIAYLVSRSTQKRNALAVCRSDVSTLRQIARRTWYFYETFVTEESHHLPPDNFQEDPRPLLVQRTSPTNIGVYLLSIIAARDFGWISFNETLDRIENTLNTVGTMKKYHGHLYNWYETDTLCPLPPLYISTVDSGNLAGHLVTLSAALNEWAEAPFISLQGDPSGLLDVNSIFTEILNNIPAYANDRHPLHKQITKLLLEFREISDLMIKRPKIVASNIGILLAMAANIKALVRKLDKELKTDGSSISMEWIYKLVATCRAHSQDVNDKYNSRAIRTRLLKLSKQARKYAFDMKFDFLERKERRLMSIGFRIEDNQLDESCYDLLASEARLSSFFAIAKGDIKIEHWFQLGRPLVSVGWKGALLSWSGSMFEYLMPPLIMREPRGSLLDQSNRLIIRRQLAYAKTRELPWGISEAAFNARDSLMYYQYTNFGVPSLGLQRGLSRNAVIAPYASMLAAQYIPTKAITNLKRLQKLGALGQYGYYDAVDFTPSRVPKGNSHVVIRNYYAHHHGMSILAINNVVFHGRMRQRFHSDPIIQAIEILLQEKAPREIPVVHAKTANPMRSNTKDFEEAPLCVIKKPLLKPRTTLLMSNRGYNVMLTANGSGYSRWNNLCITRFKPDAAEDSQGTFLFLHDVRTGRRWSATAEPTCIVEEETTTIFTAEKAEFHKTVAGIKSITECIVTSYGAGEGRQIEVINTTDKDRLIEITSYAELALTTEDIDCTHPTFSRMFNETTIADDGASVFAKRRKRAPEEADVHVVHFVTDPASNIRTIAAETDRRHFIGRGRSIKRPAAFDYDATFSGNEGCVLDAIAAICCQVCIPAHEKVTLVFWTIAASSLEILKNDMAYYRQSNAFSCEFSQSWTNSQVINYQIGLRPQEVIDYQKYAGHLIYSERIWLSPDMIARNLGKQSDLWPMSISGDYPIFVLRFDNENDMKVLHGLLRAFEYWKTHNLIIDIVILNEQKSSYAQATQRTIEWLCEGYRKRSNDTRGKPHIFTIRTDMISEESYKTLLASARIILHAGNGSLSEQLKYMETMIADQEIQKNRVIYKNNQNSSDGDVNQPRLIQKQRTHIDLTAGGKSSKPTQGNDLLYWNGYGGFAKDGTYVIRLQGITCTPHPWINVISNAQFGMHVSAEGAAFTWVDNSRDYQLTPWANDPVSNRPGEAIYIVDLESKKRFSPVAAVERNNAVLYEARHGRGFSSFHSTHEHIVLNLTHTIDPIKSLRLSRLVLQNKDTRNRKFRLYNYVEWVLGSIRAKNAPFIIPSYDRKRGALLVRNPYHNDKTNVTSFVSASMQPSSITADRAEFIGISGTVENPMAIYNGNALSNKVEAGLDPCSALAYDIEMQAGETQEIIFYIGNADSLQEAEQLLNQACSSNFNMILKTWQEFWNDFTSGFQIQTPDSSLDLMINHWLPYQIYTCRIVARAAFYQASGAYGFRDQLQDTLSLLLLKPELARKQLLNACARQFPEGDVQHWWLPNSGAGVRTLISDDVVWLGYAAMQYTTTTGDYDVLDESVAFIEGNILEKGQHNSYFQPTISKKTASLYKHCALALDLAIKRTGRNGLPLILGGDWNDSMNLIGINAKGESIWLGWFLGFVLKKFIPIAQRRNDTLHVKRWTQHLERLIYALTKNGWDGAWYRRGTFDDGTLLGSAENDECRIDAIAQSWSVISGLSSPKQQKQAMQSMLKYLLDKEAGLIRLFWPPFDKTKKEPGYIKGYPPGIRENGGQYTHGALWSVMALAQLGETEKAYEIFSMINPINHAAAPDTYRVEPYVIAADIYSTEPHRGQGGWTWYTGSAGWYYRIATETILGFKRMGCTLFIEPALPKAWTAYTARWQFKKAIYNISVEHRFKQKSIYLNGKKIDKRKGIPLEDQGKHEIIVILPSKTAKS